MAEAHRWAAKACAACAAGLPPATCGRARERWLTNASTATRSGAGAWSHAARSRGARACAHSRTLVHAHQPAGPAPCTPARSTARCCSRARGRTRGHARPGGRPPAGTRVCSPRGGTGAGLQPCLRQPPGGSKSPALSQRCPPPPPRGTCCTENLGNSWGSAAHGFRAFAQGRAKRLGPTPGVSHPPAPRPCWDFARFTNAPETLMQKQGHRRVSSMMQIRFSPAK